MSKERPILFSGAMVWAILEGHKTMTRRVAKLPVTPDTASINPDGKDGWVLWAPQPVTDEMSKRMYPNGGGFKCPYGQPGDRLWVRETWALVPRTAYAGSDGVQQTLRPDDNHDAAIYRAGWDRVAPGHWRPSIFMPRWASRITLEVTGVRVERLQDISEADARSEGVARGRWTNLGTSASSEYVGSFAELWDTINGKRGYSWESNPWVWVVEFKRVDNG